MKEPVVPDSPKEEREEREFDGKIKSLSDFHKTISEQLNARLSESPKFFWAVGLAVTAYGYVLWDYDKHPGLFPIASLLAYLSILWAIWYLAALGYAFRYLQNTQHRIEDALGWNDFRSKTTGIPPKSVQHPGQLFWLFPGIYHAHLAGLLGLSFILYTLFILRASGNIALLVLISILLSAIQTAWIVGCNYHYLAKFRFNHVPIKINDSQGENRGNESSTRKSEVT